MPTLSPRPLRPTLLPALNALLAALALPFTLAHPADLTPSLLLAVFESIISARLPIPASVRQSRTRDAKARAMLVLLGVLECDVLRGGTTADDRDLSVAASSADDSAAGGVSVDGWVDEIGLGQVDPERLADGGWEETIFVGELLCWLARRRGILPRTRSSRSRVLYSNHHSEGEGDTADLSTSLLLRPSSAHQSPRAPSPARDPDLSTYSHITDVPRHPLMHSPEPSLSASATTHTDLSIRARTMSSRTSVSNTHEDFEGASQDTFQMYSPTRMMQDADEDDDQPPSFRPRCIHELEDPSYIRDLAGSCSFSGHSTMREHDQEADPSQDEDVDAEYDDLYAPPTPTPRRVRLTGWINPVDSATELSSFIASHSRPRALRANADSGSGQPFPSHSFKAGEASTPTALHLGRTTPRSAHLGKHTPRRASPPPPSPSPPLSPKYLPKNSPPSPPSSPPAEPDPSFDISFSAPDNTSTPAKPRLSQRLQFQKPESESRVGAGTSRGGGSMGPRRLDRSSSYTPSPPSFSTPGSLGSGTNTGTRSGSIPSASPTAVANGKKRIGSSQPTTIPTSSTTKGKSPPPVPLLGSTATTNTLLTERARLLTELAALKRVRVAASGASSTSRPGIGNGTDGTNGRGIVGHRVGVGV